MRRLTHVALPWATWSLGSTRAQIVRPCRTDTQLIVLHPSAFTSEGSGLHAEENKLGLCEVIGTEKTQLTSCDDTLSPHKPIIAASVFFICSFKLVKTFMFSSVPSLGCSMIFFKGWVTCCWGEHKVSCSRSAGLMTTRDGGRAGPGTGIGHGCQREGGHGRGRLSQCGWGSGDPKKATLEEAKGSPRWAPQIAWNLKVQGHILWDSRCENAFANQSGASFLYCWHPYGYVLKINLHT